MSEENIAKKRSIKQYAAISLSGFAMGVANVIPGVSGGTMAFILGIYEELINSIRQFASVDTFKMALKFDIKGMFKELPWKFLLALGLGVGIAVISVAGFFTKMLDKYPSLTYAFFFGLVLASVFTVLKKVNKWSFGRYLALAIGAVATYYVVTLLPVATPNVWWFSLICGMIVICAMILPGISGSFLLLVLRQYRFLWGAVSALKNPAAITRDEIFTIIWVGIGCVIGLGSFVHLLNWLFKKFHDLTVATLIGFMIGSLWKLWPWKQVTLYSVKDGKQLYDFNISATNSISDLGILKEAGAKVTPLVEHNIQPLYNTMFFAALGLAIVGFIIVIVMENVANRKESEQVVETTPVAE